MHVRRLVLDDARRADGADRHTLGDDVAATDADRAEMGQRHGIPVRRLDRERSSARRHGAGERNRSGRRRRHRTGRHAADVDAAVPAGGIRVGTEIEALEHRPVDGPRPGSRIARKRERRERDYDENCTHSTPLVVRIANEATVA